MKKKKCLLLLPSSYNDGTEVPPAVVADILKRIDEAFDGHTVDGYCEGTFRMSNGAMARDKSLKVWVLVETDRVDELRNLARLFARVLKQEKLWFEVTDSEVDLVEPLPETGGES